ncbi:hypothetical protein IMCC26256_11213 [Actinobacteria bacterium IMCC26256]|nr:hypothetical protein IMCC26256_11213 [Actinobacteria bacterium IMCC26256]
MANLLLIPEEFTLVLFEASRMRELLDEVLVAIGAPSDLNITIEVDEELAQPMIASYVDVDDARISLWYSGGNFEDTLKARVLDEERTRRELGVGILRGMDRLSREFAGAPRDNKLSDGQRVLWEVTAEGRCVRAGIPTREARLRYVYRLACGFSDTADAAYEKAWSGGFSTWESIADAVASITPTAETTSRAVRRDDLRQIRE